MAQSMTLFVLYLAVLLLLAWPLGQYMASVFTLNKTVLDPALNPVAKAIYRLGGADDSREMNWRQYATAVVLFNLFGMALVYLIQVAQGVLPLNPEGLEGVAPWHLAFNTAVSFMTNTNWQAYGGESTMSYFTQMAVLTVQNFLSAATGLAVAIALIRGSPANPPP